MKFFRNSQENIAQVVLLEDRLAELNEKAIYCDAQIDKLKELKGTIPAEQYEYCLENESQIRYLTHNEISKITKRIAKIKSKIGQNATAKSIEF